MRASFGILGLFLVAALAGCLGGETAAVTAVPTEEPRADATSGKGSIAGTILDEEGVPLANVEVAILREERIAISDEEGRFTFNDLDPGRKQLAAQRLGYQSVAMAVTVEAGEVVPVTLTLVAISIQEPFTTVDIGDGMLTCAIGLPVVTVYPNAAGNVCGTVMGSTDRRTVTFTVTPGTQESLSEIVWTPNNQVFGSQLRSVNSIAGQGGIGAASGGSPLLFHYTGYKENLDEELHLSHFFWAAFGAANTNNPTHSINVFHEQRLTIYFSMFHHQKMPEGWTGIPE